MAAKKKSNKEMNDEVDKMTAKFKVMENLTKELVSKINILEAEKDADKANFEKLEKRLSELESKLSKEYEETKNSDAGRNYLCESCEYSCKKKSNLNKHKKENHPKSIDSEKTTVVKRL